MNGKMLLKGMSTVANVSARYMAINQPVGTLESSVRKKALLL
jgi:hypothetical protein